MALARPLVASQDGGTRCRAASLLREDRSGDPAALCVPSDAGPGRGRDPGWRDCGAGRASPSPGRQSPGQAHGLPSDWDPATEGLTETEMDAGDE